MSLFFDAFLVYHNRAAELGGRKGAFGKRLSQYGGIFQHLSYISTQRSHYHPHAARKQMAAADSKGRTSIQSSAH